MDSVGLSQDLQLVAESAQLRRWRPRRHDDLELQADWPLCRCRGDFGLSGSYKLQSGRQWGRTISRVADRRWAIRPCASSPPTSSRAPNVGIFDIRADKSFTLPGKAGRLTAMVDVFNLTNSATVTNFRITTGATFQEILAILDPRIVRFGVRYEF